MQSYPDQQRRILAVRFIQTVLRDAFTSTDPERFMKLILAPLRGHTDFVFRNTLLRHFSGLDACCAPFITTAKGKTVRDSHIRDVLPKYNKVRCVIPQIISKDPDEFIVLANRLHALGYGTVNWNLGCPYPMVVSKKRGAGMLPHPEIISDFLAAVIPNVTCAIDVKMRLGKDDPVESAGVLAVLNDFPIQNVIIHPRTAKQMYEGTVDLDSFERCLPISRHPVVYNGDITDVKSFKIIANRFRTIDTFMIGRGVLMNPSLAEQVKGITPSSSKKYSERLYRFHEDLVRGYQEFGSDEEPLLGRLKQLWCFLSFSLLRPEETLRKIQRANTLDDYWAEVESAFETLDGKTAHR